MAEDELRQDPQSPQDARLTSLDERLEKAQAEEAARMAGQEKGATAGYFQSPAYRVLSVLISYPLGSALIGLVADRLTGRHGIWVAMMFVGFGLAMWEVWKSSQQRPE